VHAAACRTATRDLFRGAAPYAMDRRPPPLRAAHDMARGVRILIVWSGTLRCLRLEAELAMADGPSLLWNG